MNGLQIRRFGESSCYFISGLLLARLVNHPLILCFHRIGAMSGSLLDQRIGVTSPESFRRIIYYLKVLGYRFVSLDYLADAIASSKSERIAVVTFDDGFKDLYQNAFPILRRLGVPFTLFLTTITVEAETLLWLHKLYAALDRLPGTNRLTLLKQYIASAREDDDISKMLSEAVDSGSMDSREKVLLASRIAHEAGLSAEDERYYAKALYLTKVELKEMESHGLGIEIHGHEHLSLCNLGKKETEDEIRESLLYVSREFDRKASFYCLPFGVGNQYVANVAKDLKIAGIATIREGLVRPAEDVYGLPRICITTDTVRFYRRVAISFGKAVMGRLLTEPYDKIRKNTTRSSFIGIDD
jgi:peptidoglycan/xylan/chitin deacetylase (PgdA/CDA1 family)